MRLRYFHYLLAGIVSVGLLSCQPPSPAAPQRPPVEPPTGWRFASQVPRQNTYGATFLPIERTFQERMWIEILRQPEFQSKSIDQLLEMFRPHFTCQSDDLNVIKKTPNEVIFEEKHSVCYGRPYRLTLGRLTKGRAGVSFYAYRTDRPDLPEGHRDFILNALTTAPLDTSAPPASGNPAAASPAASPNTGSH